MRSLVLASLLVACAAAPPRSLSRVTWAEGNAAFVKPPPGLIDLAGGNDAVPILRAQIEDDLRSAGLRIVAEQQDKGELQVFISSAAGDGMDTAMPVSLMRDGKLLERFEVAFFKTACWPAIRDAQGSMRCLSREISARVLDSGPVATALSHPAPPPPAQKAAGKVLSGKLAVLELRNFTKDLTRENAQYFTDVVRSAALKAQPQVEVMTRENLLVLLQSSGKDLSACEGECEVDTGRRIGADEIVSGELQRLGTLYKLSLRLHDTRDGRLLSSTQASGKSIEELDAAAQKAAEDLLTTR